MVLVESAGVMLTLDPVTGDRSQITIESSFGLGEVVVVGEVTPNRFAVDRVTLEIQSRTIAAKALEYRLDHTVQDMFGRTSCCVGARTLSFGATLGPQNPPRSAETAGR